jgi:hypothetical protein
MGAVGVASAAGPTPDVAQATTHKIFIAGSSAAASGIISFLQTSVCGGAVNSSVFTTPTTTPNLPDFRAVSCVATAPASLAGQTVTVYYRAEGGSVVGVLPVINNTSIKHLAPSNASCTLGSATTASAYSCTGVTGSATANGTDDSWGGTIQTHNVDIGVSDLEPGVFGTSSKFAGGGLHNPVAPAGPYNSSFTGAAKTSTQLQALTHATVFQQVFGFVVSNNLTFSDLPKDQIAAIFNGLVSDWSQVTLATNVAAGSGTITVCHREIGSGTRAATDLFLNNVGCAATAGNIGATDTGLNNLQTSAELDCVNQAGGNAIGYASIDNFSKLGTGNQFANTKSITVSLANPTRTAAGAGGYGFVYEASINKNAALSTDAAALYTLMQSALQNVNTTSTSAQILAIPGQPAANRAITPLQVGTGGAVTSNFLRTGGAGNSCNPLADQHE